MPLLTRNLLSASLFFSPSLSISPPPTTPQTHVQGCRSGVRSLMAAEVLLSDDYVDVSNVGGGIMAWSDAALPMVLPE